MPLVTCGMADEGVIAAEVRFSTTNEIILFEEDYSEEEFVVLTTPLEFTDTVQVVSWEVDVIRVVGCTLP